MSNDETIDSRVLLKQCKKAVEALHAHEIKRQEKLEENQLISGKEQNIWLNVAIKKVPPIIKFKPCKIPIVHPLVDPRTTPVCLITKDPQREYKDLLETHNIKFISRVVGLAKLKGKFKSYEAKRMLLKENGLFLADERILPMLPKLLGSKWFEAKKQPIPVCLTRKDLKGELERAISSTYMNQNRGTCTSIKVSTLSRTPTQILANIQSAIPAVAKHIYGGWDNIQSLNIKTNSSVSLPIWTCSLEDTEGGRWDGLNATSSEGKKRSVSDGDDDEKDGITEKPRKKVKNVPAESTATAGVQKPKKEVPKTITPDDAPLTKGDLKQKRSAGVGEKKKEKIVKAKGSSTTKSRVLGTKVAQG